MLHFQYLSITAAVEHDAFVNGQFLLAVRVEGFEFAFEELVLFGQCGVGLEEGFSFGLRDLAVDIIHGL